MFQPTKAFVDEISLQCFQTKKPIKVLSLFDGISTGNLSQFSIKILHLKCMFRPMYFINEKNSIDKLDVNANNLYIEKAVLLTSI